MQNVENAEAHDNDAVTKEGNHLVKEVDDVEEEDMEPDEATSKLMVYMRKPLLAEKCHDTHMTEKERIRWEMRRKVYALNAFGMLILGLVFSYAPQYIQVNISWVTNGSEIICLLCLAVSIKIFYDAYPRLFTQENIMLAIFLPASIVLYLSAEPGKSYMKVPLSTLSQQANVVITLRIVSFMALVSVIMNLLLRIPALVLFYERRKGKLRSIIVSKKSVALILGALSVVTALGTAMITFIQVMSTLFHF